MATLRPAAMSSMASAKSEDEEWDATQGELDRFDEHVVWKLQERDPNGPRPLTWTWV